MTTTVLADAAVVTSPRRRTRDQVRVALIGCGKMGLQHLKAIRATPHAVVVGVADPAANREQLGDLLPADARLFATAEEMLESLHPDVVHIVTPPGSHAALAAAALGAGSHVYVEKPFTPTRAEAERLFVLAKQHGLEVCAGHQCLFEPGAIDAVTALPEIGRLVHIESGLAFRTVRKSITPIDQVKDILPHAVYPLVQQLRAGTGLDDPIEVRAVEANADGDVHAMLKLGRVTAVVTLTLNGRPVEQYQNIIGTNGSLRADYIVGGLIKMVGPGTGLGVLFTPYRRSLQTVKRATVGFAKLIFSKAGSYRGLQRVIGEFYGAIRAGRPAPMTPQSIIDTVDICERIGDSLDEAEQTAAVEAERRLVRQAAALPPLRVPGQTVLVTGGTGFLGRRVAEELRHAGFAVRIVARRVPRAPIRLAGVEYVLGDLGSPLDAKMWSGVAVAVHCAAETAGNQSDHQRNSIEATQNVLTAAARAGVRRVINISSIAVLKRSSRPVSEEDAVDLGNLERGPYVWGKAEAEAAARSQAAELGIDLKTIRPGPLVDYAEFSPPGRLGREVGPWFVAIGGKRSPLSVCDVGTAARVIRSYVEDFDAAPPIVNLVEAPAPTRQELAARLRTTRPDLRFFWCPGIALRVMSGPLKLLQRIALGSKKPIDLYAAFASEKYRTDVAARVIAKAGPTDARAREV